MPALRALSFATSLAASLATLRSARCVLWLCALCLTLNTSLGVALAAPASQQERLSQAQRLIEEGTSAFQRKQYLNGIKAYQEAQALIPDVKNLYIIATAYGYLPDQCEATLDAWTTFKEACQGRCRYQAQGEKGFTTQRERCYVTLDVTSPTPRLSVSVEGRRLGVAPLREPLIAKPYPKVTFSAPGFLPYKRDLTLKPKQGTLALEVSLVPDLKPSFLDENRAFLGGSAGLLALTSLIYGVSQMNTISDARDKVSSLSARVSQLSTDPEAREATYLSLRGEYLKEKERALSAQDNAWIGVGGALVLGSLSAWLWLKDDDVKIDPTLKPTLRERSALKVSVTPWGGALSLSF